jgi:hypothetical protein
MTAIIDIATGRPTAERPDDQAEAEAQRRLLAAFCRVRDETISECQQALRNGADEVELRAGRLELSGELAQVGPRMARHWRDAAEALEHLRRR